jgi:glutaconate CoA-transferase subunit B
MSEELNFTQIESLICSTANLIEEDKSYWVAIGGSPNLSMLLARRMHAPNVLYVVEDGTIAPQHTSYNFVFSGAGANANYRAVAWKDMSTLAYHCSQGYYDYGILDCLQVDMYGNVNSSFIGNDWAHPQRRFGGAGGANEIASMCWRTIVQTEMGTRKFRRRVDCISSPGYLDGSPRAREKAGLPANTGPWRVVSDKAIFGFDEKTRRMKLLSIAPWTTIEEVLSQMDFEPVIPDKIDIMTPPTEEQLTALRAEIEPKGEIIGAGEWISYKA